MKIRFTYHLLPILLVCLTLLLASFAQNNRNRQQKTSTIEGFVFPREAKPYVEIALPHPHQFGDTIHKEFHPNADGLFKIPNLEAGTYELVYWPSDRTYKRTLKTVTISTAGSTVQAGEVTLEK